MKFRIYGVLCLFFLVFSLLPTGYELSRKDSLEPIRAFELVHNFPTDFNFYLSRIREGIEGRTTVVEKFTSEPHQGSFIHIFYLMLGWVGRWVRVPWERAGDVYQAARIVLAMTLLLLTAEFAKRSFSDTLRGSLFALYPSNRLKSDQAPNNREYNKENLMDVMASRKLRMTVLEKARHALQVITPASFWPLLAFLLAVTAGTWPKIVAVDTTWRFGGYMPWWSVMDSLQRITFIPHLLAGQALILFLIMAVADSDTMRKTGNWIFLGILAFILGIILPPGLIFVYAAVGFLVLLDFIRAFFDGKRKILPLAVTIILPKAVVALISVPSLLYLNLMVSFYPWKRLTEFDILHPLPFDYLEYIKAMGPILPLGILGLLIAVKNREKLLDASVAWVLGWIALLGIFHFIPEQSPLRFSEMIPHVPLAILSTYLFYCLHQRVAPVATKNFGPSSVSLAKSALSLAKLKSRSQNEAGQNFVVSPPRVVSFVLLSLPMLLVLLNFGVMYSSWLWQRDFVDHKIRSTYPLVPTGSYVMYPLKDWIAAMKFLQDATTRDTVILSETTAGNYMPVYSGNSVYVGHANTVRAEEKGALVRAFFSGLMPANEAKAWLNEENLHYVFFGPQEQEDGGITDLVKQYPFLGEIYKNSYVTVYKVI